MGQFKPMVKMMTTEPTVELKLKKGGSVGHKKMKSGGTCKDTGHKMMDGGMAPTIGAPMGGLAPSKAPARPSLASRRAAMSLPSVKVTAKRGAKGPRATPPKGAKVLMKTGGVAKGQAGYATGGVVKGQGGYAEGGIIKSTTGKTKVVTATPDNSKASTGDVKLGKAGGYAKGGAATPPPLKTQREQATRNMLNAFSRAATSAIPNSRKPMTPSKPTTGPAVGNTLFAPSSQVAANVPKAQIRPTAPRPRDIGTGGGNRGVLVGFGPTDAPIYSNDPNAVPYTGPSMGGYIKNGVLQPRPTPPSTKPVNKRMMMKKGGSTKKFAEGGSVQDDGRPQKMPQGNKKPTTPVAISQLSGTFKKGGKVASKKLQAVFKKENAPAMKAAKADSDLKYSKYQKMQKFADGGSATFDEKFASPSEQLAEMRKRKAMEKGYGQVSERERETNEELLENFTSIPRSLKNLAKKAMRGEGSVTEEERKVFRTVTPPAKKRGGKV